MNKNRKIKLPAPTKGYGFVGQWMDESIGWFLPSFVHKNDSRGRSSGINERAREFALPSDRAFLCEIVIKPLKDKLGRPITRKIKKCEC